MSIANSSEFIRELKKKPDAFYLIHYSCQSLYDDNEGLSPRITSIAIAHYSTQQTVSFSTHSIAEELGIGRDKVIDRFDEIERALLDKFYAFARDRRDKYWIHWNMRNLTFGFEHLEHRYRTLGRLDAPIMPVERRINLNDMLSDRYGDGYAKDPRMQSLMNLNGGMHRHFLTGPEEVAAFREREFIKMHNSTLCKVGFFHKVVRLLLRGQLRTLSTGWGVWLDRIFESRVAKAAGVAATILTVLLGIREVWKLLSF